MNEYLKQKDFIELSEAGYEEAIVQFFKLNGITIDNFDYVGKCDSECPHCEAESFSVWRKNIGFNKAEETFTFDLETAEDILDFAIYWCNKCGKWTTYIE